MPVPFFARLGTVFFLTFASPLALHANENEQTWIRGIYTGKSPRPVVVGEREAWHRAGTLASRTPGAFVLVGGGESMHPLYRSGTILVLQPRAYSDLQRGQTALYRNRANRAVAHILVAKARDGWRATGLNNRMHDLEPVVAKNFLGVVIAAFVPQADASPPSGGSGG